MRRYGLSSRRSAPGNRSRGRTGDGRTDRSASECPASGRPLRSLTGKYSIVPGETQATQDGIHLARGRAIPVIWVAPEKLGRSTPLVIWLASGISGMEETLPELKRLAGEGYLAVSFDSWGRGGRAKDAI